MTAIGRRISPGNDEAFRMTSGDRPSPWRRVRIGTALVLAIVAVGTVGYVVLGIGWFDGLYQTMITMTTVGYGETGDPDEIDRAYRVWSLGLVVVGTGAALFTVSMLVEAVVEDNLHDIRRRRRMTKKIDELSGHVVVAGWGRVGRAIGLFIRRMGKEVVVIDSNPEVDTGDFLHIDGMATEDDVLLAAGITRAHSLIAALPTDPANVYVTLSARALCPDIYIVARGSYRSSEAKFFQAGANRVVNPQEIGGSRMGAVAMQPHVAEFFDDVLHDDTQDVAVIEFTVDERSVVKGMGIGELSEPGDDKALVVALRKGGRGDYLANPNPEVVIGTGDVIIAVGSASQLKAIGTLIGDLDAASSIHLGEGSDDDTQGDPTG